MGGSFRATVWIRPTEPAGGRQGATRTLLDSEVARMTVLEMQDDSAVTTTVWRSAVLLRLLYCLLALMFFVFAGVGISVAVGDPTAAALPMLFAGGSAAIGMGFLAYAVRVSITMDNDGLLVRNLIRETRVPWSDIADCSAGYCGITIVRQDGSTVTPSAAQKPNYAEWFNLESRAERICTQIRHNGRLEQ